MVPDTIVAPAFRSAPESVDTYGPEVADLARLAGFAPDPEQALALDLMFAVGPDGRRASFEVAVICARQNLKTGLLKMAALGWLFITDQRLVVWSAHEFRTAQEAFRDMDELCASHPAIAARVAHVYRGNGDEAIELKSGARLIFKARTKGGGRGLSGDKVVLDEAFALQPVHMGALLPTLSARPDPQVVYASSAGLVDSGVLRAIRDRGRAGGDPSLTYLEWCDSGSWSEPGCARDKCDHGLTAVGCALDDRDRWRAANPALGRRIDVESIAAERRALPASEFARERLGWWDEPGITSKDLTPEVWEAALDTSPIEPGAVGLAIDVAPGQQSAAIAVAGVNADEVLTVEVMDHRSGSRWLVERLVAILEASGDRQRPVGILPGSPAGSLIPDLEAAGVNLVKLRGEEFAQACGAFSAAVVEGETKHRGQEALTTAVLGASSRPAGDAWRWSRKDSTTDICPLVAVTVARWLATTREPDGDPGVWFI